MKIPSLLVVAALALMVPTAALAADLPGSTPTRQTFNNPVTFKGAGGVTFAGPLAFASTIDFTSAYDGVQISSAITVTGAVVGDSCTLGMPAAAAALKAKFYCRVTAADTVKVFFEPGDKTVGSVALTSASPSTATATVSASSICTCTPVGATAAIAAAGCATGVSSTTLTLTGPNTVTTTMTYACFAPVDPASSSFEGYVTHN